MSHLFHKTDGTKKYLTETVPVRSLLVFIHTSRSDPASTNCKKRPTHYTVHKSSSTREKTRDYEARGTGASLRTINSDRWAQWIDFSLWGAVSCPPNVKKTDKAAQMSKYYDSNLEKKACGLAPHSKWQILGLAWSSYQQGPSQRSGVFLPLIFLKRFDLRWAHSTDLWALSFFPDV